MMEALTPGRRPAWLVNLFALLLVLASSGLLIYFCRSGPPTRTSLGIIIAILLLTPALINWRFGWPIFYIYFPFATLIRRVYLLYQPLTGSGNDPLIILPDALLGAMVLGYFMTMRLRRPRPELLFEKPLRIAIVLMIGLNVLEIFNPMMGSVQAGINGVRQFTLWIMMYFLVQEIVTRREQVNSWLYVLLLVGSVTGLYGAFQYIYDFPSYDRTWAEQNYVTSQTIGAQMRAFSTFTFTSTFSQYMVISCAAATGMLRMKGAATFARMLSPFFLACMLLGLAVTFVRSSYLGLLVAWVIGVIVSGEASARWKRMLGVMAVAAVLVSVMPKSNGDASTYEEASTGKLVADRMLTLTAPGQVGSLSQRTVIWQRVVEWSFIYPAGVGLGAGASSRFSGNYIVSATAYTESQVFSMLAELGWPGLILYLFIVFWGMAYALKVYDRLDDPHLRELVRVMLMIEVGVTVAGVSGGPVLYTLPGSAFYWAALGMVAAIARMAGLEETKLASRPGEAV
ncbi:MAG: O-antigen ligase family protein [Cyanobacteria bacterium RYN_339]|nr:O-antigen ligase family protein [Cyanobacteria bacterium RYN_339]